jgi:hypothetical protein
LSSKPSRSPRNASKAVAINGEWKTAADLEHHDLPARFGDELLKTVERAGFHGNDDQSGAVEIDGVNVRNISPAQLH